MSGFAKADLFGRGDMKSGRIIFQIFLSGLLIMSAGCGSKGGDDAVEEYDPNGFDSAEEVKDKVSVKVGSETFNMIYVNDSSSPVVIPVGTNDASTAAITDKFFIGETELTYGLWYEVLVWATNNNASGGTRVDGGSLYKFYSSGREGNDGAYDAAPTTDKNEPVTFVSWCDAIVWCNALTEWYNSMHGTSYACVYTYGGSVLRDATDSNCASAVKASGAKGFRLPTSAEWEYSARWAIISSGKNIDYVTAGSSGVSASLTPGYYWTKGIYASGEENYYGDENRVSWNASTSDNFGTAAKTFPVNFNARRDANQLGIYDMSGNVSEFTDTCREIRGGNYLSEEVDLAIGLVQLLPSSSSIQTDIGFRIARTK